MDVTRELLAAVARKGIAKQEIAGAIGIDRRTLSRSLHGKRDLKLKEFIALSEVLEIEPSTFLAQIHERENEKPAAAATTAGGEQKEEINE